MEFVRNYFKMLDILKRSDIQDKEMQKEVSEQIMLSTMATEEAFEFYQSAKVGHVVKDIFKKLESIDDIERKLNLVDDIAKELAKLD